MGESVFTKGQRRWLILGLSLSLVVAGLGFYLNRGNQPDSESVKITTDMTISQIAPLLGTTRKGLARELELSLDVPKKKPLKVLGISQATLDEVAEHLRSHQSTTLKYYFFASLTLFGLLYLTRIGKPVHADNSSRKRWYPRLPYILALVVAVVVCGFLLGKSPNPMEGIVKVFKALAGLYPSVALKVVAFMFFVALAVIGNKLICGWACPFGALQELIYSLPLLRRLKRKRLPFWLTNSVRMLLFLACLTMLFGLWGPGKGFVVYHGLNPFNLFDRHFESSTMLITVVAALLLSLILYRPFCLIICPFGLASWLLERVSLFRVRIDHEACNKCGACIKVCPSQACKGLVQKKILSPDCFSCARCLNICPQDAIRYSSVFKKPEKSQ